MTTFDERERSFEKKFAMDQELRFRARARRDKLIGEWAAAKLGISGAAVEDYIKAVHKTELTAKGDNEVLEKVLKDFSDKGLTITAAEVRKTMNDFMAQVLAQLQAEGKERS